MITKVSRRNTPTLPEPYLHLPVFVDSRLPLVEKEHFSPSRGTGQEPLPEPVREILIPVQGSSTSSPSVSGGDSVRTSCKLGKMHVQISDNQVTYSNTLQYDPPGLQGPIRRAVPFTLPVSCYYNRYLYSYKIGYTPKMRMRKIFKSMKNRVNFILTARNAQWERLSPSDQYILGKPMYFEAEAPSMSRDKRLYVHLCYVTPEKSHASPMLQFAIVKNFGCMIESKDNHSRFIPYKNNAVRFSVDAFVFKGVADKLYMHCTMSVGSSVPSPTAKSCNYDTKAGRWVELYGSDSVCSCCDSNCSSAASTEAKMISSSPWTIQLIVPKVKPTKTLKRKKVSTTTTTAAARPEASRRVTEWSKANSQSEVKAVTPNGKMKSTVKELEWPFGGGGVQWVELE
ncbi:hypothetical protein INR49_002043, partial [Caranx melampygus]